MTISDAGLVVAANALNSAWTYLQLHNGAPGVGYTSNVVGSRVATTGNSVDGDGDITKAGAWTGLTAGQAVTHVSYWSASTAGTNYGGQALGAGDTAANAAGQFNVTVVENASAT